MPRLRLIASRDLSPLIADIPLSYSARSAVIGSTRAAGRAGPRPAAPGATRKKRPPPATRREADGDADPGEHRALPQDQREHAVAIRAERDADPDLAHALIDVVRRDAV